ncbi:MAG: hypothetical protein IPK19_42180 [Chloroflexi bacterium]|nr:hypothetical protein [Chloroflexota bacterium]
MQPLLSLVGKLACTLATIALMVAPTATQAAAFTVTNLTDTGPGSLRQALADAAAAPGDDTITFSVSGTIQMTSTLVVDSNITLDGPGSASLTISGGNTIRVFSMNPAVAFAIQNVTIAAGNASGSYGGGIYNPNGTLTVNNAVFNGNMAAAGGAIASGGTLTVSNSTFSANSNNGLDGGAISTTSANATVIGSTFSGNTSSRQSGAIDNRGTLKVINSTFRNNSAASTGGAFYNLGTLTITNSTFSNNTSSSGFSGTAITNTAVGLLTLNNSLVSSSRCSGAIVGANNVATIGSGCPAAEFDSLLIGALADNGGPTPTIVLLPGSPAVNAGDNALLLT